MGRDVRFATLHPEIRQAVGRYIEIERMEVAVFEAFKAVNNRVKAMTKLDLDGSALMGRAFADVDPPILLGDLSTETGRSIQAGNRFVFMGVVQGIRNPDAHEQFKPVDEQEGFEKLGLASMLMRRLDEATLRGSSST